MTTRFDFDSPFEAVGGRDAVIALAEAFYDAMDEHERPLAELHELDQDGNVSRRTRDRFGLFLIGWLGGPRDYMEQFGHPRLRMRHHRVPINTEMADAWVRAMTRAMDAREIGGPVREFLDMRFKEVAYFLRNRED